MGLETGRQLLAQARDRDDPSRQSTFFGTSNSLILGPDEVDCEFGVPGTILGHEHLAPQAPLPFAVSVGHPRVR